MRCEGSVLQQGILALAWLSNGKMYELATAKETALCRLAAMRIAVLDTSTPCAVHALPAPCSMA